MSDLLMAEKGGVSYQNQVMSPKNLIGVKETSQTITEKSGENEGWLVLVFFATISCPGYRKEVTIQ